MKFILVTAVAIAVTLCGPANAKPSESAEPLELKKIVVTPATSGTPLSEEEIGSLSVGQSRTIVTASGAVVSLVGTENGVEIYVDGDLLGVSDHLSMP